MNKLVLRWTQNTVPEMDEVCLAFRLEVYTKVKGEEGDWREEAKRGDLKEFNLDIYFP